MNQALQYTNTGIDLLIVVVLIIGIRQFRAPRGARRGNLTAAFALVCAFFLVLFRNGVIDIFTVVISLFAGSVLGYAVAGRVNMIQIPAMVAFQNGAGGVAAFIVSLLELTRGGMQMPVINQVSGVLGLCIGALTFSGSMVASAKLANKMGQTPQILNKHSFLVLINVLALVIVGIAALFAPQGIRAPLFILQILLGLAFGVLFSIRIGGADMPVLISLLNATTGLAAALCGMVIANQLLIAAGATVLASGSILTYVMCKAMNRNLGSILIPAAKAPAAPKEQPAETQGAFMPQGGAENPEPEEKKEKEGANDLTRAAHVLENAREVIIVPGYGMALARAQFKVVELADLLEERGVETMFAIHPVAGRMPGHMNVMLAEAEVDYDKLLEMDVANEKFPETDAVLIFGACDVVNPAAIQTEGTPISGMPILMAHEAGSIIVCNYDSKPGYSGEENPLYEDQKSITLFGDALETADKLIHDLRSSEAE